MSDINIKPTRASLSMMRAASVIIAIVAAGMIVGVVNNGLLEEGGVFVIVWIAACVGIVGFALFLSFNPKGAEEGIVRLESDGDLLSSASGQSVEARLKTLDDLKRQKLISDDEYRKQREKIIQSV
ncbi:MAG: hypothetical protein ACP5R6_00440 [Chlorobaculum sp.]